MASDEKKKSSKLEIIKNSDLPLRELKALKKALLPLEKELERKTNLIDIIGEIEISHLLGYDLVKNSTNKGFDALSVSGIKKRIQIKSTRAPTSNYRLSTI